MKYKIGSSLIIILLVLFVVGCSPGEKEVAQQEKEMINSTANIIVPAFHTVSWSNSILIFLDSAISIQSPFCLF